MSNPIQSPAANEIQLATIFPLPSLIVDSGERTSKRFIEFFAASIRNKGTRQVYLHAILEFFDWCDRSKLDFKAIEPIVIATYIEGLCQTFAAPTVKVRLAAIKMLYDYFVTGQIVSFNPAAAVRGPKHAMTRGKTPVLTGEQAAELMDSIETSSIAGLRDRALIATMIYSFARIGATVAMDVGDYHQQGRTMWLRLYEKNSKHHEVPVHPKAEQYLDGYILAARIEADRRSPLFRSLAPNRLLTSNRMSRTDAFRMVKRRCKAISLPEDICCHSFRATGITNYLENGGTLEKAMQIACHSSARTTKLYDRTDDDLNLSEIERIRF